MSAAKSLGEMMPRCRPLGPTSRFEAESYPLITHPLDDWLGRRLPLAICRIHCRRSAVHRSSMVVFVGHSNPVTQRWMGGAEDVLKPAGVRYPCFRLQPLCKHRRCRFILVGQFQPKAVRLAFDVLVEGNEDRRDRQPQESHARAADRSANARALLRRSRCRK